MTLRKRWLHFRWVFRKAYAQECADESNAWMRYGVTEKLRKEIEVSGRP